MSLVATVRGDSVTSAVAGVFTWWSFKWWAAQAPACHSLSYSLYSHIYCVPPCPCSPAPVSSLPVPLTLLVLRHMYKATELSLYLIPSELVCIPLPASQMSCWKVRMAALAGPRWQVLSKQWKGMLFFCAEKGNPILSPTAWHSHKLVFLLTGHAYI